MKRRIFFIILVVIIAAVSADAQKISSEVSIIVTDMEGNISSGDKILFKSETDGTVKELITDSAGKGKVRLNNGERYQIKINSFEEASNYTAVDIADAGFEMQGLELTIRFSLPETYTLKNVNFASGSAVLTQSSYKSLNDIAELLTLKPNLKIELAGHTDSNGDDTSNLTLSQKRADAVRSYLIKKGISPERLVAKGYGETIPVASNNTPEGRLQNRRTDIHIIEN